jgi:hypothetical protein
MGANVKREPNEERELANEESKCMKQTKNEKR